jgi:hypothetical protein
VAAGGRLELEPDRRGEMHYKLSELVRNANRFGKAPSGTHLRLDRIRNAGELLERRRRMDQALFAVVMEAYQHGVSTRKVDDLVRALGADSGISK